MNQAYTLPQLGTPEGLLHCVQTFGPDLPEEFRLIALDLQLAGVMAASGAVPTSYLGKPEAVFVAIQFGRELGIKPTQAPQNISVVNGKCSVYGDMMLALAMKHRDFEDWEIKHAEEKVELKGFSLPTWVSCTVKRKGRKPIERVYTVQTLAANPNWKSERFSPWKVDPIRMMEMRARAFALRDAFPDVLTGVYDQYEAQEIVQAEKDVTLEVNQATSTAKASVEELNREFFAQNVPTKEPQEEEVKPLALPDPAHMSHFQLKEELFQLGLTEEDLNRRRVDTLLKAVVQAREIASKGGDLAPLIESLRKPKAEPQKEVQSEPVLDQHPAVLAGNATVAEEPPLPEYPTFYQDGDEEDAEPMPEDFDLMTGKGFPPLQKTQGPTQDQMEEKAAYAYAILNGEYDSRPMQELRPIVAEIVQVLSQVAGYEDLLDSLQYFLDSRSSANPSGQTLEDALDAESLAQALNESMARIREKINGIPGGTKKQDCAAAFVRVKKAPTLKEVQELEAQVDQTIRGL